MKKEAPFKEMDQVVCLGGEHTHHNHGGGMHACRHILGRVMAVAKCTSFILRLHDDPINYYWHPDDFRLATKAEIRRNRSAIKKPKLDVPLWVHNIQTFKHYKTDGIGNTIRYAIYDTSTFDTTTPSFESLMGREVGVWLRSRSSCFASLSGPAFSDAVTRRMNKDKMWYCVDLSYGKNKKVTRRRVVRWFKLLIKNKCLPDSVKYEIGKEHYTLWLPLNTVSNRYLFQVNCFVRNPHEQPFIVPTTVNLVDNHNMNFFIAYVAAHYISDQHMSNHTMFLSEERSTYYGRKDSKEKRPQEVVTRARKIEKYTYELRQKEPDIVSDLKDLKYPGNFRLASYVNELEVIDAPAVKGWNDLKGLNLKHSK